MHDAKDFIAYIAIVVALFFVLGSCDKAEDKKREERLHEQYQEGYNEGYATGYEEGYADGGLAGWEDALDEIKYLYGVEYPELRR